MKKTVLTLILALILGLGADAQNSEMFDWNTWDNTAETYYDGSDVGMFDWDGFTELYDQASQNSLLSDWFSDFSMFDFGSGDRDVLDLILPDHGGGGDVNAPLGNGIALLLGMGGTYLFAKRRKEEE